MTALLIAVLASSLAGSLHCVAMCGPLVGLCGNARSLRLAGIHALGRLATYVVLGTLAGVVGGAVELAGRLATAQHAASLIAGVVIVGWGLHSIAVARGWIAPVTADARRWKRGLVRLRTRRPGAAALWIGVLTGLLPCGWLWAFVVAAAGTASPWRGGAVMAAFWLGTVPAMTGVLAIGGAVIARLRRRLPVVSATVLIALGLLTLAGRWQLVGDTATRPACHGGVR